MKLSKAQRRVVECMQNGGELVSSTSALFRGSWLQHGGKYEAVSTLTVRALVRLGLVAGKYAFPAMRYALTDAGRELTP